MNESWSNELLKGGRAGTSKRDTNDYAARKTNDYGDTALTLWHGKKGVS